MSDQPYTLPSKIESLMDAFAESLALLDGVALSRAERTIEIAIQVRTVLEEIDPEDLEPGADPEEALAELEEELQSSDGDLERAVREVAEKVRSSTGGVDENPLSELESTVVAALTEAARVAVQAQHNGDVLLQAVVAEGVALLYGDDDVEDWDDGFDESLGDWDDDEDDDEDGDEGGEGGENGAG